MKNKSLELGYDAGIGSVEKLPKMIKRMQKLDPGLYSVLTSEFPDLASTLTLAPALSELVEAKDLFYKKKEYSRALQILKTCPQAHQEVIKVREAMLAYLSQDYLAKFDALESLGDYQRICEVINDFYNLVEATGESPEFWPWNSTKYKAAFPNFGSYVNQLRDRTLDYLIKRAQSLLQDKSQGLKRYKDALRSAENAISIAPLSRKSSVSQLYHQIAETGSADHLREAEKAVSRADYNNALDLVRSACDLDRSISCESEIQKIEQQAKRKSKNDLVDKARSSYKAGRLKDAIKFLEDALRIEPNDYLCRNLLEQYRNEEGNIYFQEGQRFFNERNWPSALESFTNAASYFSSPAKANEMVERTRDQIGREYLDEAVRSSRANQNRLAVLSVRKARPYLKDQLEANRLENHYKALAMEKVAIILQTDNSGFGLKGRKTALLNTLYKSLEKDLGEWHQLINSDNIPIAGPQTDIAALARNAGANWAVVISVSNYRFLQQENNAPTTYNYCRVTNSRQVLVNPYPYPAYWAWVYDYKTVPVYVYNDRASASMNIQSFWLNAQNDTRHHSTFRTINASWSQEVWRTRGDIDPREIRLCPSSCQNVSSSYCLTRTLDQTYFERERSMPDGNKLLEARFDAVVQDVGSVMARHIVNL